ncbi:DUF1593 domain-containing protein [Altererythrobacter sediminis]|uniref:DUF1593 domain-containing protein n=1 Tax=Allopontixanthobacter sediminis TaxID=1689985 RepID=A0A845BDW5_9SPHN|nr:DUF1593 domain-containing protein [Allopontixanthobacter sediminis]MXP45749.1 DUF1593 domain-containing protein [Allopontixanthobacter sediminis]
MGFWLRPALVAALIVSIPAAAAGQVAAPVSSVTKPRLFILTDIEADPDDTQSLIRLLLYANEIDLEGLVATTSVHQKNRIAPESIRRVIAEYAKVRGNLARHDTAFPQAAALYRLVGSGQPVYGTAGVGSGKSTDGSRRLIAALERPDPRPLWVAGWGGPNTLAQALHDIRATRSPEAAKRLISKLRVYTISDQDDSGPWMRKEFPQLFYVVSPGGYGAATWTAINSVVEGIDNTAISNGWFAEHIQQGHGPLGAAYPDTAYGVEGDTPSFLGLIPNGLNVPERPDWGGWGGRYELRTPERSTTNPDGFNGGVPVPAETRPIWTNAVDSFKPYVAKPYGRAIGQLDRTFTGFRETLWRWRDEFQNDFAARMDWTVKTPADANHPPVVRLAHPDRVTVRSGDTVPLSALGTTDPDGDSLSYQWFQYPEAGTYPKTIEMWGAENLYARGFTAPVVDRPSEAHFILKVTDKGTPALTRYRRVVVTILPKGS